MRIVMVMAAALGASCCLAAGHPGVSFQADTYSQYVWRGMVVTNGPVFQTSTTVTDRGFRFGVFTNMDLDSANQRRRKFSELDFDAGYDRSIEKVTLSGGMVRYTFPNTGAASTTELYGSAAVAVPLRPTAKVYLDVGAIKGTYGTFDVSHVCALPKPTSNVALSAEFSAGMGAGSSGHNKGYFGVSQAGMVDFHSAVALPVGIGRHLRIVPKVGHAAIMASALRKSRTARAHNFYFGLSLGFTF